VRPAVSTLLLAALTCAHAQAPDETAALPEVQVQEQGTLPDTPTEARGGYAAQHATGPAGVVLSEVL